MDQLAHDLVRLLIGQKGMSVDKLSEHAYFALGLLDQAERELPLEH